MRQDHLYTSCPTDLSGAAVNGARRAHPPVIGRDAACLDAAADDRLDETRRDHSACGVGLVARISGEPDRDVVELALGALAAMEHRGGVGADGEASDGAGVLTAIPWRLLEAWLAEQRLTEPRPYSTAVGMVFLPREHGKRSLARELVAKALRDEGLVVVGWREVPLRPEALPPGVRERHPCVEQVVAHSPTLAGDELERALLLARRAVGRALHRQRVIRRLDDLYICSLSSRTVVYKGMLTAPVLPEFYPDLQDPRYVSHFAVLHRRFSTNTAPRWNLAQPMRLLAHNGEINTLLGNLAWMRAREPQLVGQVWDGRIAELLPVVHGDSSDSGALDKFVEVLVRSGRSPLEAMMMAMPAAGAEDARVADFYDYYAGVQEAWDGPALVAFADGRHAGACVDRNGLRPARFARTRSGMFALASEAGAVDLSGEDVVEKGRLGPGQMIALDFEQGRLLRDDVVKTSVASRRPYGSWLAAQRRTLAARAFADDAGSAASSESAAGCRSAGGSQPAAGSQAAAADLVRRQAAAGFTAEDVELIVRPMARHAREPRFSMGNDAPLPVLSGKPHVLYDYFTERFAQVTNPAIDPLRERLVMSLAVRLGPRGDLLTPGPEHARRVDLPSPVLNRAETEALSSLGLPTARVSTAFAVAGGPWGLREAVEGICRETAAAVRDGAEVIVLTDRLEAAAAETSHVPPLLAVGAVHHDLIRRGLRSRASLVAETAQCWSVHHFACLIGYGASAVHPYLAFETVRDLWERGRLAGEEPSGRGGRADGDGRSGGGSNGEGRNGGGRNGGGPADLEEALRHYRVSAEEGLRKILSKMGISLLASYHGAQLFEAVGLGADLIDLAFAGTPSRIGGLSVEELARETVWIHQQAFPELTPEKLQDYGFVRYRPRGEYHLNNPDAAKTLRRACVEGLPDLYRAYSEKLRRRPPTALRDLLTLAGEPGAAASGDDRRCSPDQVEPADAILPRFCTGGMSLGALSREAHETIAVAMARIHGRSNSGEGGEDACRDAVIDDVDERGRSARFPHLRGLVNGDRATSQIRQVASGRFGVTTAYLAGAEQLEIKVAQGAKPGEGGELPGDKVTPYIAGLRRAAPGVTLISPPPHHDIYSIEDLAELIYDLRMVNPRAAISVKLVAGTGIGTIAAGVAKAGADVIHVSGHGGGTAAASLNSIKHAGIPWELGLADVHRALVEAGFRDRVTLRVDGDLRTGRDVVVAAALGADEFAFGTAVLLAEGCVMARVCHQNRCPVGVATQDPERRKKFRGRPEHIVAYFRFVAEEVCELLGGFGLRSLDELVGRTEYLELAQTGELKTDGLDRYWFRPAEAPGGAAAQRRPLPAPAGVRGCVPPVSPGRPCDTLDDRLLADPVVAAAIERQGRLTIREAVATRDRAVGARLAGEIAARYGDDGFGGELRLALTGSAGQSLGAFLTAGLVIELTGEANDYVGKGMAGGELVLRPAERRLGGPANVIAGNTCLYGATGGRLFAAGRAGERFAVRNSAAVAVVEGAGDHCCEYMTGGVVAVLGAVGRNACAGMTGGTAYFRADAPPAWLAGQSAVVDAGMDEAAVAELTALLEEHLERTGSETASALLSEPAALAGRFVRVRPAAAPVRPAAPGGVSGAASVARA
ncbi:MAG: glutamate synthase subunit alpha [Actinobacteria bacterium]|nr:glutamate synthase subunit alpha [Actinomycetota bacterium]